MRAPCCCCAACYSVYTRSRPSVSRWRCCCRRGGPHRDLWPRWVVRCWYNSCRVSLCSAHDPIVYDKHYLTPLFEPRSVAVVGATEREGAIASIVLKNLLAAKYRGHLFAVNPRHATVHGVPSFPSLDAVPERIDLAVVVTPAATVPQVIEDAGRAGVRAAVILTAGVVGGRGGRAGR